MTLFEKLQYNEHIALWLVALQQPYAVFVCATMFKAFEKLV